MIANDVDFDRLVPQSLGPRLEMTLVTLGDGRFQLIHCTSLTLEANGDLRAKGWMPGRQGDPSPVPTPAAKKTRPSYLKVV